MPAGRSWGWFDAVDLRRTNLFGIELPKGGYVPRFTYKKQNSAKARAGYSLNSIAVLTFAGWQWRTGSPAEALMHAIAVQ